VNFRPMGSPAARKPRTWVFVVLLSLPVMATLIFLVYVSYWNQIVSRGAPVNERVETFDESDFLVVLTTPNMDIPVHNVFIPKEASVFVDIYPKTRINVESVKLSGNTSSSLIFDSTLHGRLSNLGQNITNVQSAGQIQNPQSVINYETSVQAYHPLEIRKLNQTYILTIVYRTIENQSNSFSQPIVVKENFGWPVDTWDLGNFNYFWIIFSGVLLSRIFPLFSNQGREEDDATNPSSNRISVKIPERIKLGPIEFLWVPFSAIITLLIFTSFKGQIQPTSDIIGNMALAFGFGFGFDKVLGMGYRS
jgi:hypothetical protein